MNLDRVIAVRNSKTVYQDGDTCIKVFTGRVAAADVLREAANQAAARDAGLPVPEVLAAERVPDGWAIASRFVYGRTLSDRVQRHPEERESAIRTLAQVRTQIHASKLNGLESLKSRVSRLIVRAPLAEEAKAELIARTSRMPDGVAPCHGDLMLSNVIECADGGFAVVDWARACRGRAAADDAMTLLLLEMEEGAETANAYRARLDSDPDEIAAWTPLVAASRTMMANERERTFLIPKIFSPRNI